MKTKVPLRSLELTLLSGCLGLAWGSAALAQNSVGDDFTLQRVEITGSNIKRIAREGALPVVSIGRDEIEKSGASSAADLIAKLSSNPGAGYQESQSVDGVTPGLASVSLRGLGEGTTLILLNGRRLATFAFGGLGSDLGAIPLSAIDRVEVLTDGASAIYGTDAIGGVINFILRNNYRGLDASLSLLAPQRSGGGQRRASLSGGVGDPVKDGFNAFAALDVSRADALRARQRDFGRTGYRPEIGLDTTSSLGTFPANVFLLDANGNLAGITNPAAATGCPQGTLAVGAACNFDEAAVRDLLPKSEKVQFFGRAALRLAPEHQLFVEALLARNRLTSVDSPANFTLYRFAQTGQPPVILEGSPFYPAGFVGQGFVPIGFRAVPAGDRVDLATTQARRLVAGAEGTVGAWDYNAALVRATSTAEDAFKRGFLSNAVFGTAFDAGLVNPFGSSDAAGDAVYQQAQQTGAFRRARAETTTVDGRISRELLQMSAGPLAAAAGVEARREKFRDIFDDALTSDTIGFGSTPSTTGARSVWAIYGELSIPLSKELEVQAAFRHDRYSDAGSSSNPKLGLRWQPNKEVLMRASAGTGFRAPSLRELYTPPVPSTTGPQSDPLRCPTTGLASDCDTVFLATASGNPKLKPEKARQWSAGLVFEGNRDASLSIDYWSIEKRNDISLVLDPTIFANFAEFASAIQRGPVDPAYPTLPGPITGVAMGYYNFGTVKTDGLDLDLSYRMKLESAGQLRFGLQGTYTLRFDRSRGIVTQSSVARADNGAPIPRWRHTLSADWSRGDWNVSLRGNHVAGYRDEQPGADGDPRRVGAYDTWDLNVGWAVDKALKLNLGIKNLLDADPPTSNQQSLPQSGYDPRLTDPRGRALQAKLEYSFR